MKPTIYDVAEKAGVSIATVSKVINQTGRISEKTINKVNQVMDELDYQPSSVAAALTGKKTYTIGVLVPDISNPFFAEVARAFENSAQGSGYTLILCSTDHQTKREHEYIDLLFKKQVDGIIIATELNDYKLVKKIVNRDLPLVLFTVDHPSITTHVVTTDDMRGGYLAGSYLTQKGHTSLTIMMEKDRKSSLGRLNGFKQALTDSGISLDDEAIISCYSTVEDSKRASKELLNLPNRPTAVFACTDLIAICLMNEARKQGLSIPEDLSIIGFDNTIYAEIADPGLTTIEQPIKQMAACTFEQLLKTMEMKEHAKQKITIIPQLVERSSVKDIT
ncbi:LacI family transcriptional regulator [Bacillus albus]|uniref:Transcriptional regulator n=1 Tax=Bacillus albus TaxID=2026189 RepID=A0A1J9TCB6_9BACI|nr:LacI family DNA-binding transcriptional regulator [Bacillus albus]KMP38473.1 transcriptional regulator [Bacillus cereus]OJD63608.1 transcriptional regulator [Bacillus albus]RXJ13354.1 LacI family transcriptional regulator [Bacillus albus]RXJ22730.1 LacI family transcriptional regulator [Bacillus albus]RXJ24904.1 LacI family transcriptional regulator [Bacillus albus]